MVPVISIMSGYIYKRPLTEAIEPVAVYVIKAALPIERTEPAAVIDSQK